MKHLLLLQYDTNYYYHCSVVKGAAGLVWFWMARLRIFRSKISEIRRKTRALTCFSSTSSGFSNMNWWFHEAGAWIVMWNSQCRSCLAWKGVESLWCNYHRTRAFLNLVWQRTCRPAYHLVHQTGVKFLQKPFFMSPNSSWLSRLSNLLLFINFFFHFFLSFFHISTRLSVGKKNIDIFSPYRDSRGSACGRYWVGLCYPCQFCSEHVLLFHASTQTLADPFIYLWASLVQKFKGNMWWDR